MQKLEKQYHIHCEEGDVGRYVILPGDPGRCEKIAALFDDGVELISSSGETAKTVSAGKNGKRVICAGSDVYVQYVSNITKN